MKRTLSLLCAVALLSACASNKATNEVQADMPVAKESAQAGAGNTVTLKGNALPLAGTAVEVGKPLPAALLSTTDLKPMNLAESSGKVRVISVVPSLDTPVCDAQTHELSEKNGGLDQDVELITVSMDLPFAQKRFSDEAKISNVTFLSDYKSREFGNNNGLLIEPLGLLARAVIVTDKDNIVRYVQVVPEVTALPDMQEALRVARGLI